MINFLSVIVIKNIHISSRQIIILNVFVIISCICFLMASVTGSINVPIGDIIRGDISELTKIRGIGPWTAEMFLMFGLKRKDVFSIGDLALLRAVSEIYKVDYKDHKKIIRITNKWKPYRSIVSWYLWEYLGV